jgi:hypothetical protein
VQKEGGEVYLQNLFIPRLTWRRWHEARYLRQALPARSEAFGHTKYLSIYLALQCVLLGCSLQVLPSALPVELCDYIMTVRLAFNLGCKLLVDSAEHCLQLGEPPDKKLFV